MPRPLLLAFLVAATAVASCAEPVTPSLPTSAVSFRRDVAPLLTSRCAGCHMAGGPGASQLVIFDEAGGVDHAAVQRRAEAIVAAVQSGRMPLGSAKLSAAEAGVLAKWQQQGALDD